MRERRREKREKIQLKTIICKATRGGKEKKEEEEKGRGRGGRKGGRKTGRHRG